MVADHPIHGDENLCPNCSATLTGPYCASCGQRQRDLDRPFRDLAGEALDSFLSFDVRILETVRHLIALPGFLTTEFLSGRRVRYAHPLKLYIAVSVLYFLALALTGYTVVRVGPREDTSPGGFRLDVTESEAEPAAGSQGPVEPSLLGRVVEPIVELAENDPDRLNRVFTDRLAKSIILLVPVFAALLLVLYRSRRYLAHLVFSLHLHSFAFLALVVGMAIDWALRSTEGNGIGNALAVLTIAIYSFVALRRVYGRGRLVTALVMGALLIGYLVALIVTMFLTLALTVVTV